MILDAILLLVGIILLSSVIRGAPFVPSKRSAVARMVELAEIKPGQKVADLGSGDGRILIAMARAGAEAHGFEINPFLVWWSRFKIHQAGLSGKAQAHWSSFWGKPLAEFDVITVFGVKRIMKELEKKLKNELQPNAKVLSYVFVFPAWQYEKKDGAVFLYRKN